MRGPHDRVRGTARWIAIASASLLLVPAGPAGAASTTVTSLQLTSSTVPSGTSAFGLGSVTFGDEVIVVGTDPAADVSPGMTEAGMDLTRLTIASDPAKPNDLVWTYQLTALPANGGMPEAVFYWWRFSVDGGDELALDARFTNLYRVSTAPFFRIRSCPAGSCTDVATPQGTFDPANAQVRATVRVSTIPGATGGSALSFGTVESSLGSGARWVYGLGDQVAADATYRIPFADVQVGLASPGGTPASWVAAQVTGSGADRSFSFSLPTSGTGLRDVVVRACWGGNCGESRAPVTLV